MLAGISIDYDSSKKEIYLTGDVDALKKNRFAWRYVKDYLHPIVEEKRIVISINEDEPFSVLSKISSMLSKYGFSEVQSDSSEQVLQDYFNEEQRFGEFSKKALDIRNNDCNAEEFKHFTDAVAEHYFFINDCKDIDSYNVLSSIFANRCIFSSSGDFSIIDQMLSLDHTVFDKPSVSLSWNGKVFYPRK